jgi:VWFA-related protein
LPSALSAFQQQPPVFRAGVDIVQLDVSVLDQNRRPVSGLVAGDFAVFEDGRPQPIVAFSAIDVPESEVPAATWMSEVTADVQSNSLEERRLFVLVVDDAMLPHYPPIVDSAKRIARDVIGRLGPTDLAAVVFTRDNRASQEFTSDRRRLLAAVDKVSGGSAFEAPPPPMPESALKPPNPNAYFYQSSIRTLNNVARFLTDVPERRKALVYVSVGVPVDPERLAPQADPGDIGDQGMIAGLVEEMRETFRQAQRANVNIYGIDPGGLDGLTSYFQSLRQPPPTPPGLYREFLQTVSENTGGLAVIDTNAFATGVAQMFRENSSYYLLGFRPANAARDGKFRRLEVRVHRPGLIVRAREGYYAPTAASERPDAAAPSPLVKALTSPLPRTEMTMRVNLVPFATTGSRDATVAIILSLRQPPLELTPGVTRVIEEVDLQVTAFTTDGDQRGTVRQNARVTLRGGVDQDAVYEVLARMSLKPGRYQLRLAAHNKTRDKTGSVFGDVEVPDFTAAPLSLSGVVLDSSPGLIAAPRDALSSLLPLLPTSERDFSQAHVVRGFARIYQGARSPLSPVAATMRILNRAGATVLTQDVAFIESQFGRTRTADWMFDVPMFRLTPGPHVLRLDVRAGAKTSASRDVMFTVR